MSHPLPPFENPSLDHLPHPHTPPGELKPPSTVFVGLELAVSGLDWSSKSSAQTDFVAMYPHIVQHACLTSPQTYMPLPSDLKVVSGNARQAVDYVFISLSPSLSATPHLDILYGIRCAIIAHGRLKANWKVTSGYDRTQRGFFNMDSANDAENMKDQLAAALNSRGLLFQFHTITPLMNSIRVAFDFLDPASIENLESNPIVINHHVFLIFQPCFIVLEFGYDIAITGCGGIQGFQGGMDAVIHDTIGPHLIIWSRMELNGDTYIVIMDSFDTTIRLLNTDLPLPWGMPPYVTILKPMYLFFFNLHGCPASPTYLHSENSATASANLQNLQQQIDLLCENSVQTVQSIQNVFNIQNQSLMNINISVNALQNVFAMSVASQTGLHHLTIADNELTHLHTEQSSKELFLLMTPNDDVKA
ncbi:uncharacterized protein EV420DRAFT_1652459 [Desarmillaria tabescens]|uniref:Uncharacterized protein n=1 Tax=Armillaria tabescens TaxID=1929756 RepID=A0AA39MJY8_ARMTA|nr:uncharacterized protein EV420DRAFT_1652459 [Desarmillaria tabescens]KAK0436638.1 hypothetical protein EV420DRAFT_1652459 [Desarmillaria tabescens]